MPSKEILNYFDHTVDRQTRDQLVHAVQLVKGPLIAIDCGCGAGSDIAFLRSNGFLVYAFDIEAESIERCRKRFVGDDRVRLTQTSFNSFNYPNASLIVADASLFFCPKAEFTGVWGKISAALLPNGVIFASFLGPDDSMAGPGYNRAAYWPEVMTVSEEQLRDWLSDYEIESLIQHRESGIAADGQPHQWHVYSVVARKPAR